MNKTHKFIIKKEDKEYTIEIGGPDYDDSVDIDKDGFVHIVSSESIENFKNCMKWIYDNTDKTCITTHLDLNFNYIRCISNQDVKILFQSEFYKDDINEVLNIHNMYISAINSNQNNMSNIKIDYVIDTLDAYFIYQYLNAGYNIIGKLILYKEI